MKKEDFSKVIEEAKAPKDLGLNMYQAMAAETRLETASPVYCLVNLSGEVGELHSLIAKGIRDGVRDQEAYSEAVRKELGDVLWQLSMVALDNGFLMADVAATNINKLRDRQERSVLGGQGDNR